MCGTVKYLVLVNWQCYRTENNCKIDIDVNPYLNQISNVLISSKTSIQLMMNDFNNPKIGYGLKTTEILEGIFMQHLKYNYI